VTKEEFLNYYKDVNLSCPSEEYFLKMISAVWSVSEDDDSGVFKEALADFISKIRLRLLEMSNDNLEEFVLRKIFNHFDVNRSGTITFDEFIAMIAQLKLQCERKYAYGIFKILDSNGSGCIEFEEFLNYILYNPYKI